MYDSDLARKGHANLYVDSFLDYSHYTTDPFSRMA